MACGNAIVWGSNSRDEKGYSLNYKNRFSRSSPGSTLPMSPRHHQTTHLLFSWQRFIFLKEVGSTTSVNFGRATHHFRFGCSTVDNNTLSNLKAPAFRIMNAFQRGQLYDSHIPRLEYAPTSTKCPSPASRALRCIQKQPFSVEEDLHSESMNGVTGDGSMKRRVEAFVSNDECVKGRQI